MSSRGDRLPEAPEGTCIQIGDGAPIWMVRGRSGWYRCDAEAASCSCSDSLYRRAAVKTACRHLRALTAHLLLREAVRQAMTETERAPLPSDAELRRIFA